MPRKNAVGGKAQAEQTHTCAICRREIMGDYEYIKTKRGAELYICYGCAHPRKSMI